MEDFQKFLMYMKRPGVEHRPCIVSEEIFDLLAEGQATPFLDYQNVKVFNEKSKDHAERLLKHNVSQVVI